MEMLAAVAESLRLVVVLRLAAVAESLRRLGRSLTR